MFSQKMQALILVVLCNTFGFLGENLGNGWEGENVKFF